MPVSYTYKRSKKVDPRVLQAIMKREFGDTFVGILMRGDELAPHFDRPLTPAEKKKLDDIMSNLPDNVAVYEYTRSDITSEIEKAVGVKPLAVDIDERRQTVRVIFDRELTKDQETRLEEVLRRSDQRMLRRA